MRPRFPMIIPPANHEPLPGRAEGLITNIFHCDARNIGDQMCGPAQYLWSDRSINLREDTTQVPTERVVVGGGQIFSQLPGLVHSVRGAQPNSKIAGWGVGLPIKGRKDQFVREVVSAFDVFGTRNYEWRDEIPFVPCASCLSQAFELDCSPKHEVVIYEHRRKPAPENVPSTIPVLKNDLLDIVRVIDFLASGETVVTSSYHGVYWAQLLGRKVICLPYNEKFRTYQYCPTMANPNDWLQKLKTAKKVGPLLGEYREINMKFRAQVEKILGI